MTTARPRTTLALFLLLAPLLLGLGACAAGGVARDPGEMLQELGGRVFTVAEIEEIERLQPQLPRPFRLAIAPPVGRTTGRAQESFYAPARDEAAELGTWTPDEREVLERWTGELAEAGLVRETVFLPTSLVTLEGREEGAGPDLLGLRTAAARSHADAVLVVQRLDNAYTTRNPLCILDVTLVGMVLVPGYRVHAQTAVEGLLVDTRNEYLYASGSGYAERARGTPAVYVGDRERDLFEATRLRALEDLGRDLAGPALAIAGELGPGPGAGTR